MQKHWWLSSATDWRRQEWSSTRCIAADHGQMYRNLEKWAWTFWPFLLDSLLTCCSCRHCWNDVKNVFVWCNLYKVSAALFKTLCTCFKPQMECIISAILKQSSWIHEHSVGMNSTKGCGWFSNTALDLDDGGGCRGISSGCNVLRARKWAFAPSSTLP